MAGYSLLFSRSAAKELRAIPGKDLQRLLERIEQLAREPRPKGCEKLVAAGFYRVRQGAYRVVYAVDDETNTIDIYRVAHRSKVYKNF